LTKWHCMLYSQQTINISLCRTLIIVCAFPRELLAPIFPSFPPRHLCFRLRDKQKYYQEMLLSGMTGSTRQWHRILLSRAITGIGTLFLEVFDASKFNLFLSYYRHLQRRILYLISVKFSRGDTKKMLWMYWWMVNECNEA
jgi:hypothetical protein